MMVESGTPACQQEISRDSVGKESVTEVRRSVTEVALLSLPADSSTIGNGFNPGFSM